MDYNIIKLDNIIPIVIMVAFIGFVVYKIISDRKSAGGNSGGSSGSGIGNTPPSFLKGFSYGYGALSYSRDKNIGFLNLLKEYNCNMMRVLCYGAWGDFNWKPWTGGWSDNMGNMDEGRINHLKALIDDANSRGIWIILSLFQDNSGGGTEDITSHNKNEITTYISKIVEATKGKGVIYETANEIGNKGFQEYILSKLNEYGVRWTCSYNYSIGATYLNVHTLDKNYIGGHRIHSNDVGGYTRHLNANDYKNIAKQAKDQGGHFEFLAYWGIQDGEENHSPDEIRANWSEVLEYIKVL